MVTNTFNIRLPKITTVILQNLQVSMGHAGAKVMQDVQQSSPQVPVVTGALSSSGTVIVNGKLRHVSQYVGGVPDLILSHDNTDNPRQRINAHIIFGMPYAAEVHATSRRGPNYLSAKLAKPRAIIVIIAEGVKE